MRKRRAINCGKIFATFQNLFYLLYIDLISLQLRIKSFVQTAVYISVTLSCFPIVRFLLIAKRCTVCSMVELVAYMSVVNSDRCGKLRGQIYNILQSRYIFQRYYTRIGLAFISHQTSRKPTASGSTLEICPSHWMQK